MEGSGGERKKDLGLKIQRLKLKEKFYISKIVDECIIGLDFIFD